MGRAIRWTILGLVAIGCQTVPDPNRPLQPLPVDGAPLTYRDVIQRARMQATVATEAFYVDHWADLERAALSLEETARYVPRSLEVPATQKASVDARSQDLAKASQDLLTAARTRDEKKTTETMQRINLLVREMRPE